MAMLDPQAILSGSTRRGASGGVITAITLSSVCLALFLGVMLVAGGGSFIVAATLSLVTLVPMMAFVMALDSLEPEPRSLLVATFLWGAGASVMLSVVLEGLGAATLGGLGASPDTTVVVVVAPIVEETMKGLAVFAMFWFRRSQLNGITDGVVYAATCALGFAAAENIVYYIGAAQEGGAASLAVLFVMRGVMSPFCHPVFTAMTGIGIVWAVRARGAGRWLFPIGGLLLAMLLHGMWNGLATTGLGGLVAAMTIVVGVLIAILVALRRDRRQTIAQIESCMAEYVPTGLVTGADLAMLSSLDTRKRARAWALSTRGKTGFNAMRDYQLACTKLTMLHERARLGMVGPYEFERQRWLLLTLMHFAREAFLGPAQLAVPMVTAPWAGQYAPQQHYAQPQQFVPLQRYAPQSQPAYAPQQWPAPPPQPPNTPPQQFVPLRPAYAPRQWPAPPPQPPNTPPGYPRP